MTGTIDRLAKHRRSDRASVATGTDKAAKTPYEAFRLSATERRFLEIRLKDPEPAEAVAYHQLTTVIGEWRGGSAIQLVFGAAFVVNIKGKNLTALFRALQTQKVEFVEVYDPDYCASPTDYEAGFITSIEFVRKTPNPIPPRGEMH